MPENDFIWRFTPSRTEPQVLEDIFVQRQSLLADLADRIRESAATGNKHHVLLVGPRGTGKTHLISLLHHRVTQDEELARQVRIAWLLEDETITSFVQLLKRIFEILADEYPAEFSRPWLDDLLQQTPAQIQKALESELIARFSGQTLLLFIENMDYVFDGLGDRGQRQWRAFLQEHPFTSLVATSQRLFQGVQDRNLPFFGFFAPIHLKPLVIDDAVELLRRIAVQRRQTDLSEFLQTPEGRSRVRALHHLAGGNHRIYIVLSGFITRESLDELVQPFEKMADELTPYFQERLRWLSAQQRQIVEFLCTRESPCTPKEIARQLLAAENTISSQLKKLLDYGYLTKNPRGRESLYELTEPLMRLASEVKDKRHKPLRLLVDFLRVWYRPDDLTGLLAKAGTESLRAHLSAAITDSQSIPDPRLRFLQQDIEQAKAEGRLEELVQVLEERAHTRGEALDWFELAYYHAELKNHEAALECYDKALDVDPEEGAAWFYKGSSLYDLDRFGASLQCFERALECFEKALDIDPTDEFALTGKGSAQRALKLTLKMVEIKSRLAVTMKEHAHCKAEIHKNESEIRELTAEFDRIIEVEPEFAFGTFKHCWALFAFSRWESGFAALREAFVQHAGSTDHDVTSLVELIQKRSAGSDQLRSHVATLIEIYADASELTALGEGLVRSLNSIDAEMLSEKSLQTWRDAWLELGAERAELEIPLRIFRVGIEYLIQQDERVLLDLVATERTILRQALALDSV
ncbi:MAG: tetratricopeptide repeat protein [Pirellulaceae bacterium]